MVYVGEVCRYLVNQPPSELDRKHKIRVAIGNGMRENVWTEFNARFGIRPLEFYAASEGNCTLINIPGKTGACGFMPVLNSITKTLPMAIIKIDDQMKAIRNENGFCIPCKPYEKGAIVGVIGKTPRTSYSGYANDKNASDSKILHDLFRKDQNAFNSGNF
jgi:solute carrier family 27 fatty acid transporter 1/4